MSDAMKKRAKDSFWEKNRKSNGSLLRTRVKSAMVSVIRALFLLGLCFMIVQPLIMKISVSFMAEKDLYDSTITLLPRHLTLDNFALCISPTIMDYWTSLLNTAWISLVISILQVSACALVGYGFARFEFIGKKFWFAMVILCIMVPPQVMSPSLFTYFTNFDLLGLIGAISGTGKGLNIRDSFVSYSLISVTCMGLKNGIYIYLFRQHFKNFPISLEEAAYLDGAGYLRTFTRVLLPGAVSIILSCFLFAFVWTWTDRVYTEQFLRSFKTLAHELPSVELNVEKTKGVGDTINTISMGRRQQMISVAVLLTITPLLILYVFAQRGFVESLTSTGLKD